MLQQKWGIGDTLGRMLQLLLLLNKDMLINCIMGNKWLVQIAEMTYTSWETRRDFRLQICQVKWQLQCFKVLRSCDSNSSHQILERRAYPVFLWCILRFPYFGFHLLVGRSINITLFMSCGRVIMNFLPEFSASQRILCGKFGRIRSLITSFVIRLPLMGHPVYWLAHTAVGTFCHNWFQVRVVQRSILVN